MLSPYRVLDLTDDRGELASMILGDLGADVIKVEPPEGSSSRRLPPFLDGAPESERSLQYFAFNRNKRGITLDLTSEHGQGRASEARLRALISSSSPPAPARWPPQVSGSMTLSRANPQLVYVAITPYGQDGPYADFAASDLTLSAMGGQAALQGVPERAPVRITVPQVWLHASSEAAVAALIAHARMLRTGEAPVRRRLRADHHGLVDDAGNGGTRHPGARLQPDGRRPSARHYRASACATSAPTGTSSLLPNGATIDKMVHWIVEDGVVPEEWLTGEEWRTYDIRLLQGQPLNYSLEEVAGRPATLPEEPHQGRS